MTSPNPVYLDDHARRELMDDLARIPDLAEDLDLTLAKVNRFHAAGAGARQQPSSARLPIHLAASAAGERLESVMRTYTVRVSTVTGARAPAVVAARARWLAARLPGVPGDSPVLEGMRAEVGRVVAQVAVVIDRPAERQFLGWCLLCGVDLYALVGEVLVECGGCGAVRDTQDVRAMVLMQARARLGGARELARLLPWFAGQPVSEAAIRKAGDRGLLPTVTVAGRVLYRVGDVVDWQARGARSTRRRKTA